MEPKLLSTAPNLTVGKNHVRLVGREYHAPSISRPRLGWRVQRETS